MQLEVHQYFVEYKTKISQPFENFLLASVRFDNNNYMTIRADNIESYSTMDYERQWKHARHIFYT